MRYSDLCLRVNSCCRFLCLCRRRGGGCGLSVRSAVAGSAGCLSSKLTVRLTSPTTPPPPRTRRRPRRPLAATRWHCAAHSVGRGSPRRPASTATSGRNIWRVGCASCPDLEAHTGSVRLGPLRWSTSAPEGWSLSCDLKV